MTIKPPVFDFSGKDAPPSSAEPAIPSFGTMSAEDFAELQVKVFAIQERLVAQSEVSIDEEKLINIWFRERRGVAMSVVKEKVKKVAVGKAPRAATGAATRATPVKRVSAAAAKREAVADLFKDLFA